MPERLDDVEEAPVRGEREPVGEVDRLAVPELAGAVRVETVDARPWVVEAVAVGDVEAAVGVEGRVVRDPEAVREELRPVRAGREAEHGRVLQVADVEVARGRER